MPYAAFVLIEWDDGGWSWCDEGSAVLLCAKSITVGMFGVSRGVEMSLLITDCDQGVGDYIFRR